MKELFADADGGLRSADIPRAIPAPLPGKAATAGQPDAPANPLLTVLHAVMARPLLAAFLTASVAGILVPAVRIKLRPSFAGEALISVAPVVPTVAYTGEAWRAQSIQGFYSDYLRTLVRVARTPEVAASAVRALDANGVAWLPEGVDSTDAGAHLAARVEVRQVRDTQLISVRFTDAEPAVVAPVVNAVTGALISALEDSAAGENQRTQAILCSETDRLNAELEAVHAQLDALSVPLGSAMADERHNIFFERINALQESFAKSLLAAAEAEAEHGMGSAEAERLRSQLPEGDLDRLLDEDVSVRDARVMLGRLARDEESRTGHLSDKHPERIQATERLAEAARRVERVEGEARQRLRGRLERERDEAAEQLLVSSAARLEGTRRALDRIEQELESARAGLREHGRAMFEASKLRGQANRLLASLDRLTERAEAMRTESRAPGRVTLAASAVEPRKPDSDKRKLGSIAAVMAALLVAAAGTTLVELRRGGNG